MPAFVATAAMAVSVTVTGSTVCDAVGKLVSALKYADQRPQLTNCDPASDAPIVINVASR